MSSEFQLHENNAVATVGQNVPAVAAPLTILETITEMARNPNCNIETAERLLAMQERIMEKQATIELDDAISRISKKLAGVRIVKRKSVGYDIDKNDKSKGQREAFRYTPLEDIDKIVHPLLDAEDITFSCTMEFVGNGLYNVTGTLSRKGAKKTGTIPLPLDGSGGKNNIQGAGSSFSYGQRYVLTKMLNIVTVGEDNDGAGAPITTEQAVEIDQLIKRSGIEKAKFLSRLNVEDVRDIPTKDYARAVNSLKAVILDKSDKKKGESHEA